MNKSKTILIAILLIGISFGAGYYSKPDNVKEVVKYKESKNIVIVKTRYVYPDGTIKEQIVEKDKSITELDSEKVVTNRNLGVRVKIATKIGGLESEPIYALGLDSPPLLKLFKTQIGLSASVNTEQEIYGGVYVQF